MQVHANLIATFSKFQGINVPNTHTFCTPERYTYFIYNVYKRNTENKFKITSSIERLKTNRQLVYKVITNIYHFK